MEAVDLAHWAPSIAALLFIIGKDWYDSRKMRQFLSENRQTMDEVHGQVTNGGRNLRDDIDRILSGQMLQNSEITGIRTDIGQLRSELRVERVDRIAADDQIHEHIKLEIKRHPDV